VTPLACPGCGAELPQAPAIRGRDRLHGVLGEFAVHVCPACGSGRTTPLVATADLGALYPQSYNAYALPAAAPLHAAATALFRWRYWRALRRPPLGTLGDGGRLLDVGSGRGDLGVTLASRGWRVTGLEPSPDACAAASARGVPTVQGTLTTADDLDGGYDAIVFQHSLEHVTEPLEDLRVARKLLRDGGLALISLPNFGSWQARRFGTSWFHLDLPRHRSHFTATGLETLLRRAGFGDIRTTTSTTADGLPMSVQYRRYGERRYRSGASAYAVTALSLAGAPLTALADRVQGGGDVLHAVAATSRSPRAATASAPNRANAARESSSAS
jgi:SAM-dependent methyltransferase